MIFSSLEVAGNLEGDLTTLLPYLNDSHLAILQTVLLFAAQWSLDVVFVKKWTALVEDVEGIGAIGLCFGLVQFIIGLELHLC